MIRLFWAIDLGTAFSGSFLRLCTKIVYCILYADRKRHTSPLHNGSARLPDTTPTNRAQTKKSPVHRCRSHSEYFFSISQSWIGVFVCVKAKDKKSNCRSANAHEATKILTPYYSRMHHEWCGRMHQSFLRRLSNRNGILLPMCLVAAPLSSQIRKLANCGK